MTAAALRNTPSVKDQVSAEEWQLRLDLAALYRLAAKHGMTDLTYTHFSARVPGDADVFLLNPYGLRFDQVTASSLVKIDVDGSPLPGEALTIVVSSPTHPDYTQEDLIDLLTIGQLKSSEFATGSSADPARGFLTGQVLNQLERELIREAPWLDVVDVRGGTDPNDPIVISFRAITEPQWSVRYSQELSAHPGREVSLSYRISNLFFLNASADQKEDDLGSSAETYSLDFRVRYEF